MAAVSKGNIITSPQTITGSFVDVKDSGTTGEIETLGYTFFGAYIELDINDSKNVQFRFRTLDVTGGTEYYIPFKTIRKDKSLLDDFPEEVNKDVDQNFVLEAIMDNIIPIIKLQVKALTVGSTAGIITTATFRQGYSQ